MEYPRDYREYILRQLKKGGKTAEELFTGSPREENYFDSILYGMAKAGEVESVYSDEHGCQVWFLAVKEE